MSFDTLAGTLNASDSDADPLFFGIGGGSIAAGKSSLSGNYGVLSIDIKTGDWTYAPDDLAIKGLSSGVEVDNFTVTASDGAAVDSKEISISISDVNDPAVIVAPSVSLKLGDEVISGIATHSDKDAINADNIFEIISDANSVNGYGIYSVTSSGAWSYSPDYSHSAITNLDPGQTLTDSIVVTAEDGTSQNIEIELIEVEGVFGGIGNDVISVLLNRNIVYGGEGNDQISSDSGNDKLFGQAGNDKLNPGGGNDVVDGGEGIDTAIFTEEYDHVTLTKVEDTWTLNSGTGETKVVNIERLAFSDKNIALDLDGHAGETVKLLGILLGKEQATNPSYLGQGLKYLDDGLTFEQLMSAGLDFVLGADASSLSVVELIWNNLVGPPTPADNISQYADLIDNGTYTPVGLALVAAEHPLNLSAIDIIGLAQTGIEYVPVE